MEISDIRFSKHESKAANNVQLKGYCSVTFDQSFVVHDVRILKSAEKHIIARPNQRRQTNCSVCYSKNAAASNYCSHCGKPMVLTNTESTASIAASERHHRDIAHPITQDFRKKLEEEILMRFQIEFENL
ncbi:MAG: septation protein SpoVG family protein [Pirellulaceae bacterium]